MAQETPNRETGSNTYSRALRLRNYDGSPNSAQTNIDISGNTFIAQSGPGYSLNAYAVWITYINPKGAMNNANVNLHDNTIEGIVNTTDTSYHATALDLDGIDAGINLGIQNNNLVSNDTSLGVGGANDLNINGVTLMGNTLDKLTAAPVRPYTGIQAGYWHGTISNVTILDTQLADGATSTIVWVGSGTKQVAVGWLPTVQAQNSDGSPVAGATVAIFDRQGKIVYQGLTNTSGILASMPITTTIYSQTGTNPANITIDNRGGFSILVSSGNRSAWTSASLLSDTTVTVTLS